MCRVPLPPHCCTVVQQREWCSSVFIPVPRTVVSRTASVSRCAPACRPSQYDYHPAAMRKFCASEPAAPAVTHVTPDGRRGRRRERDVGRPCQDARRQCVTATGGAGGRRRRRTAAAVHVQDPAIPLPLQLQTIPGAAHTTTSILNCPCDTSEVLRGPQQLSPRGGQRHTGQPVVPYALDG